MLKVIIVILFIAIIASLTSGFLFLIKSLGVPESKRTLYALGVRVTLASLLMILIGYGLQTQQLSSTAPWDQPLQTKPKVESK